MKIIPGELKSDLANKFTVFDAKTVRSAWQANTELAHMQLILLDSEYRALSDENWQQVMNAADTSKKQYLPNYFDCDKFAFLFHSEVNALLVNGVGLVLDFSGKHAFNVAIVSGDKPTFKFIEPQTDGWIQANSKPCYSMNSGLVIL